MIAYWSDLEQKVRGIHMKRKLLEIVLLMLILVLAAFLRFYNLRANPGWYSDEGAFANVATHLLDGRWQYFALQGSPLLVGRPPLFFVVLAGAFKLFGVDIAILRGLTGIYGLLTIVLLYFVAHDIWDSTTALLAAAFLAIYPGAVAYSRVGFTYNQLAPLFLLAFYSAWKYGDSRRPVWGLVAGLTAGLALATDYLGVVAAMVGGLALLIKDRRMFLVALAPLALVPLVVMAPAAISAPEAFLQDVSYTFARVGPSPAMQLVNVVILYSELLRREMWVALGLMGLFLLPGRRGRGLALLMTCATLLLFARVFIPLGHHLIPILPFIALGAASLVKSGAPFVLRLVKDGLESLRLRLPGNGRSGAPNRLFLVGQSVAASLFSIIFLFSPFLGMLVTSLAEVRYGQVFVYPEEGFSVSTDARAVADYLRAQSAPSDVLLASPQVAWALPGKAADFQQALACAGHWAYGLPPLGRERFAFDCSPANARYVVLDDFWRGWGAQMMPDLREVMAEVERWPLVLSVGEFRVYRNPK